MIPSHETTKILVKSEFDQCPGALKLEGQAREVYCELTIAIRLHHWALVPRSLKKEVILDVKDIRCREGRHVMIAECFGHQAFSSGANV